MKPYSAIIVHFLFFALVAFDVGGVLRLLFVLLASPFSWVSSHFISESAGFRVLIFATLAGMKLSDIESAARAVLPKFYSTDLHPEAWQVFSYRGKKCVLSAFPRVMVEEYFKNSLAADMVLGTEIGSCRGRATGFVVKNKAISLEKEHIWLEDRQTFAGEKLVPKSIIFHDGRLVQKPTPLTALYIILWFPVGFVLALLRGVILILCPIQVLYYSLWALGVRVYINGTPPRPAKQSTGQTGVLFACSHRTLLEALMVSIAIGRPITSVTYSMSAISEMLSPIKTVRLSRDRSQDACTIKKLLDEGDLVICPEGTTCREPILLRFSALFAELTDQIVPVAMASKMSMFHGTTVRGWKAMDPIYFLMNPSPTYEVTFLNKLPQEMTCSAGKSSHDVANYVQGVIAESLGYECTRFTRKDKYRALAGNDGVIGKALR